MCVYYTHTHTHTHIYAAFCVSIIMIIMIIIINKITITIITIMTNSSIHVIFWNSYDVAKNYARMRSPLPPHARMRSPLSLTQGCGHHSHLTISRVALYIVYSTSIIISIPICLGYLHSYAVTKDSIFISVYIYCLLELNMLCDCFISVDFCPKCAI